MTRLIAFYASFFAMGCNMQRTGGEESIPKVLHPHEDAVTYCRFKVPYNERQPCVPGTTKRCPLRSAFTCFKHADDFNPLEHCNTDCREIDHD